MSPKREAGLSLIELAIVVLGFGIVASIAIPNVLSATRSYKLNIAATAVAQQLNLCRQIAVRSNLPTKIQFSSLQARTDADHDGTFTSSGDSSQAITQESTITITTTTNQNSTLGANKIEFSSRGDIPVGDTAPVLRVTYGSRYRVITVDNRGAVTVGAEQ